MLQKDLKSLIASGSVDRVVFKLVPGTNGTQWYVFAYDKPGKAICSAYGNQLITQRGPFRTYINLDRAYKAIVELGWAGEITIDSKVSNTNEDKNE